MYLCLLGNAKHQYNIDGLSVSVRMPVLFFLYYVPIREAQPRKSYFWQANRLRYPGTCLL